MTMERLILGTAGHIDHGKTTLVRALTGTDTDRLPEEKRRGITVDIGFAALDLEDGTHFGVVDVPGHEAFVRNMLAGATGVDVALLVVAADEGVMPQTREHLAILALLDVRVLVVALTKTDLVDDEWLELAADDVRSLLQHTPWPDAPVIPVAGVNGTGLDALRAALAGSAHRTRVRRRDDLFRMPVDRVFTAHGTGTIVTGTVWSGTVQRDAQLRLLPSDRSVRVRGVQSHGASAAEAGAGERAALAVAGLERSDVARGDVLVQGDAWATADILTVLLTLLPEAPRALEPGDHVRIHLGTAEAMARVTLMGASMIEPGETAWAQLRLERPLVARARDRVVVRSESPVVTIAGGIVAEPDAPRRGRLATDDAARLRDVIASGPEAAIVACASLHSWQGTPRTALPVMTGLPPADIEPVLPGLAHARVGPTRVFARSVLDDAAARIERAIDDWHGGQPLEPGCERDVLKRALPARAHVELLHAAIDDLVQRGRVSVTGALHARAAWQPQVSAAHGALLDALRAIYREAGLAAPTEGELPEDIGAHADRGAALRYLARQGELTAIEPGRWVWSDALRQGIDTARTALAEREELGPGDFREVWGVTRKHLIPLLEYLDRTGVTERVGDARRFGTARGGAAQA